MIEKPEKIKNKMLGPNESSSINIGQIIERIRTVIQLVNRHTPRAGFIVVSEA